jgi:hypothetical protein
MIDFKHLSIQWWYLCQTEKSYANNKRTKNWFLSKVRKVNAKDIKIGVSCLFIFGEVTHSALVH